MLQLTNLVQVITECRSCSANAVLRACARQSAPTVRARTLGPRPNSVRTQRLDPFAPRLWLAPEAVRACARARSRLRPQLFRLAPGTLPWTTTSDCQPPRRRATVRKVTAVKKIWNSKLPSYSTPRGSYKA
jgi:hypothetical protein